MASQLVEQFLHDTPQCKTHTQTQPFNGPFSRTTRVSRYQKGKTNLDFTEARDSEWQWHQLGHMQVCTSLQTDNHTSTPPLSFLQATCPSCHPTNSVKALKAIHTDTNHAIFSHVCHSYQQVAYIICVHTMRPVTKVIKHKQKVCTVVASSTNQVTQHAADSCHLQMSAVDTAVALSEYLPTS